MSLDHVVYEDNGVVIGIYDDLATAQAKAQSLVEIYASTDPLLSVRTAPTCYACILTRTISRDFLGITLTKYLFN